MTSDLSHLSSVFPLLAESVFMSTSLAVILIDWNHSFLETSLLRLIQSYLPRWRNRNIRQDVYICLVIAALGIIYHSSMKQLSVNMEICRVTAVTVVVLLSFWFQRKCVGTPKVPVSDKSVGGSRVTQRDQTSSASSCCGVGIPRHLLSLSSSCSSEPHSEVNIEEELTEGYVEAFRELFDEEEVTQEELVTAIQYLNTLKGGIAAHRKGEKLTNAVDHIRSMGGERSRLDDSGLPQDYTYEELRHIVVDENEYSFEDFERVLGEWLKNNSFLPSPEEFVEIHHNKKGIVQLEKEVAEKEKEVAEKDQEISETRREMEETLRVVEETTQEVRESRQKNQSLRERLQQKERIILQNQQQHQQALQQERLVSQQKDRMLQQERQRVRMLEERIQQLPEGVLQRRVRELEMENHRLSAQSHRSKCKICWVKEVQVFFTPCNHLISCQGCVDSLPKKKCPICRKPIKDTVTMSFA
ncbi:golgin subfamily A member 6-like protein 25 [Saccostrea cucullata]|uniref:golgin subfamily A member 6-like protein 25 n=1 Tax=Saccostrea cuccullata TaxID=36930 RepID=UPI002ED45669